MSAAISVLLAAGAVFYAVYTGNNVDEIVLDNAEGAETDITIEKKIKIWTLDELKQFDDTDKDAPIMLVVMGQVIAKCNQKPPKKNQNQPKPNKPQKQPTKTNKLQCFFKKRVSSRCLTCRKVDNIMVKAKAITCSSAKTHHGRLSPVNLNETKFMIHLFGMSLRWRTRR
jgi:hypothetical protein